MEKIEEQGTEQQQEEQKQQKQQTNKRKTIFFDYLNNKYAKKNRK